MATIASFEYKCRKCGTIFDSISLGGMNDDRAWTELEAAVEGKATPNGVRKTVIHRCDLKNQSSGVADLVGYRIDEMGKMP